MSNEPESVDVADVEPGEVVPPIKQMPESTSRARIARGTIQIGLPGSVITLLSVFDVVNWDELQTTAVLAFTYQMLQMLMNMTAWGRRLFAPDAS